MDPFTHTLTGLALAETGLKRRSRLATPVLLLGSNAPDVDALAYLFPADVALWFRRGVTHGVLALVVLPAALTLLLLAWDRWWGRRFPAGEGPPLAPRQLLALSCLAVWLHPALDTLNNYGMRWLAPFSGAWIYGDSLFILDPWMLGVLAAGVVLARRRWRRPESVSRGRAGRPALVALLVFAAYAGLAGLMTLWGRAAVEQAAHRRGIALERMMASPVPLDPFARSVVVEVGERYLFGRLAWRPWPALEWEPGSLDKGREGPLVAAALARPEARRFLAWARFPYHVVGERDGETIVFVADARYARTPGPSWARIAVRAP